MQKKNIFYQKQMILYNFIFSLKHGRATYAYRSQESAVGKILTQPPFLESSSFSLRKTLISSLFNPCIDLFVLADTSLPEPSEPFFILPADWGRCFCSRKICAASWENQQCCFRTGLTQTGLYKHRKELEARNFGFK